MTSLPNELLESMFAYFADVGGPINRQDLETLRSICLTSRRLYHVAQPLLFRRVLVNLRSEQPKLLLATLRTRTDLCTAVKDLFLGFFDSVRSTLTSDLGYTIRQFLEDVLPALPALRTLRSNHRFLTPKLIESLLYKAGNGYSMSVPIDLGNLQSLELFADHFVFKYHFILRLPRLRRVVMRSTKISSQFDEDAGMSDGWGWTSPSIKELVFCVGGQRETGRANLLSNTLKALSRSLPNLESLRIEQTSIDLDPGKTRYLIGVFAPQLELNLRQLEIVDGQIVSCPRLVSMSVHDDLSAIDRIQHSKLEYLRVDWHTLFDTRYSRRRYNSLPTLRHLMMRYVEIEGIEIPDWSPSIVLDNLRCRFPSLQTLVVEVRLRKPMDQVALQEYRSVFQSAGIVFRALENPLFRDPAPSPRRIGSIISTGRPSTLSP
jgi:hypothetical protein